MCTILSQLGKASKERKIKQKGEVWTKKVFPSKNSSVFTHQKNRDINSLPPPFLKIRHYLQIVRNDEFDPTPSHLFARCH